MASYYDEDDELDMRIRRGRAPPRDPRRPPPQPVRFASPVTGPADGSTRRRRHPAQREPRDVSSPEESRPGTGGEERAGRRSSPILGERERQTSSPSPIPEDPKTDKVEDSRTDKTPARSSSSEGDGAPKPRPSKVRSRDPSDGSWNDENTVYTAGYLEGSDDDDDIDVLLRRGRDQPRRPPDYSRDPRYGPPPPPTPSRGASKYEDDDELDIRIQRGRETPLNPERRSRRPSPPIPSRAGSRYVDEDDDELDIRIQRGQETPYYSERRRRSAPRPMPSRGASYYDEDDELDIRVRRGRDPPYITPSSYLERRYRPAPPPVTSRDASRYYEEDDDDLDIRVRRGRDASAPGIYPDHQYRPHRLPYYPSGGYLVPQAVQGRNRSRRSRSPEPVIINNRIYNDYNDDPYANNDVPDFPDYSRSRRRPRSRSPPSAAAPVIINNRIYNDLDEDSSDGDEYRSLAPSMFTRNRSRTRSRAKLSSSAAPVMVNNRIYNDYEEDDYDPPASNFGEPEFNFIPQAYPFSLSRHSKSRRGSESVLSSVSGTSDKEETANQEPIKKESGSGRSYNILRSQYVGDGVIGRPHVVHIALMPEPVPSPLKGMSPVFRWVHFEDKNMDLEHFENNALNIAVLSQLERGAISKLLSRAKKGYDKPLQTSTKMKTRFMVPSFLQDSMSEEKRPKDSVVRTISWLCVPYFCLDKYSTPSGLRASSHPMRTLLQARFGLTQKERDMKQAVRWLGNTPAEHCFYIAQVWFIIIDDSLIVSCARPSMVSLQGDSISVLPKTEVERSLASPNILVSTKSSLLWALPLDECQSWFAFTSHFLEYWPLQVEITYNGKSITMPGWPRILLLAQQSTIRLFVEFRPSTRIPSARGTFMGGKASEENPNQDPNDSTRPSGASDLPNPSNPSLRPMDHRRQNRSTKESSDRIKEEFHVFTWLNANDGIHNVSPGVTAVNVDYILPGFEIKGLEDDMKEIDTYLSQEIDLGHRLIYNSCPLQHRLELDLLLRLAKEEASSEKNADKPHITKLYEAMADLVNSAESLFGFFFPLDFDHQGSTIQKYWGALHRLLQIMSPVKPPKSKRPGRYSERLSVEVLEWFKSINRSTMPFAELFSQVPPSERSNIPIPEELTTAWLHLILALASSPKNMRLFDNQMVTCSDLIEQGIKKVVASATKVELPNYAVFPPFEFASLIAFQLCRDDNGSATEISDTYLEYLKSLQSDIEANPLDRSHQDRIVCLKQEIEVISETLDVQQYVLRQAQRGFGASRVGAREDAEYPDVGLSRSRGRHVPPIESSGVQSLIIQDNLALVENRIKGFREMREIASELGDWNIQKIDSNKDRQEAAIYAFTVVTIIFLPLGTVAGIMGMNTSDVRDMPFSQWVYWATALPLTVLVIALCLAWAGELNNFWEGLSKLWRRNSRHYAKIPEKYEVMGRRPQYKERAFHRPRRSNTLYGNKESYV